MNREKNPPQILLEVQGVAYEVDVPMSTFYNLANLGEKVTLFTHLVVREDAIRGPQRLRGAQPRFARARDAVHADHRRAAFAPRFERRPGTVVKGQ